MTRIHSGEKKKKGKFFNGHINILQCTTFRLPASSGAIGSNVRRRGRAWRQTLTSLRVKRNQKLHRMIKESKKLERKKGKGQSQRSRKEERKEETKRMKGNKRPKTTRRLKRKKRK